VGFSSTFFSFFERVDFVQIFTGKKGALPL